MRELLRRLFSTPVRESGRDYLRGVGRHWIALTIGLLSLAGATQVVFSFSLPYWAWLGTGFALFSWAQFLAFHDVRTERNEKADEYRIGQEARRHLEHTAITLRQRVAQRDLIVQWHHELRVTELLFYRLQPPTHPLGLRDVQGRLEAMNHHVRIYLKPLDTDAAERFLAIPISEDDTALLAELRQKQQVLQDFIDDPAFFPPEDQG